MEVEEVAEDGLGVEVVAKRVVDGEEGEFRDGEERDGAAEEGVGEAAGEEGAGIEWAEAPVEIDFGVLGAEEADGEVAGEAGRVTDEVDIVVDAGRDIGAEPGGGEGVDGCGDRCGFDEEIGVLEGSFGGAVVEEGSGGEAFEGGGGDVVTGKDVEGVDAGVRDAGGSEKGAGGGVPDGRGDGAREAVGEVGNDLGGVGFGEETGGIRGRGSGGK